MPCLAALIGGTGYARGDERDVQSERDLTATPHRRSVAIEFMPAHRFSFRAVPYRWLVIPAGGARGTISVARFSCRNDRTEHQFGRFSGVLTANQYASGAAPDICHGSRYSGSAPAAWALSCRGAGVPADDNH